ncbi:hypothetical protein EVA_00575, partial [gut metagenome]
YYSVVNTFGRHNVIDESFDPTTDNSQPVYVRF